MASAPRPPWSLTTHLASLDKAAYEAATQSPFLLAAGQGRLDKRCLGAWLANDRLYIHAYIRAVGRTLNVIDLPQTPRPTAAEATAAQLVDWLLETLTALRREDRFFVDVAARYGVDITLESEPVAGVDGGGVEETRRVVEGAKVPGLRTYERLFASLHPDARVAEASRDLPLPLPWPLPWLEAAVVFWGTETVYSEAWRWAKSHQTAEQGDGSRDADGGALRRELVPNWANDDFVRFVQQLSDLLDRAVSETVEVLGEGVRAGLVERAERVWREVLDAEVGFWPKIE